MLLYKLLIIAIFLLFSSRVFGAISLSEIYPAPTSGNDEWVELYNNSSEALSLSDYYLQDATGKKLKFTAENLAGHSYGIATSSGVLNNTDESISLYKNDDLVEIVTYGSGLDSSKSFTKCNNEWIVTTSISKFLANVCITLTPPLSLTSLITPTVTTPSQMPSVEPPETSSISLSEIMVHPQSGQAEWIELYNNANTDITLTNWYIDDIENGGSSPRQFSITIPASSFAIYELTTGIFNNDEDSIRLLNENQKVVETYSYTTSSVNKTWGRVGNEFCLQEPSKGKTNTACTPSTVAAAVSPKITPTKTPKPTVTPKTAQTKTSSVKGTSTFVIEKYKSIPYTPSLTGSKPKEYRIYPVSQQESQRAIIRFILFLTIFNSLCWCILLMLGTKEEKNYWYSAL